MAATCFSPAQVADFACKTIEWIIPFSEGGGSEEWARFYAPLLQEALPGKSDIVVRNMPGAGSTKGANYFAARVKPDGLTIFGSSGSTQFPFLLGDPRVKFDYADWHIVLAPGSVADGLIDRPEGSPARIVIEHPSGTIDVVFDYAVENGEFNLRSAGVLRTARKLFSGNLFIPAGVWP